MQSELFVLDHKSELTMTAWENDVYLKEQGKNPPSSAKSFSHFIKKAVVKTTYKEPKKTSSFKIKIQLAPFTSFLSCSNFLIFGCSLGWWAQIFNPFYFKTACAKSLVYEVGNCLLMSWRSLILSIMTVDCYAFSLALFGSLSCSYSISTLAFLPALLWGFSCSCSCSCSTSLSVSCSPSSTCRSWKQPLIWFVVIKTDRCVNAREILDLL